MKTSLYFPAILIMGLFMPLSFRGQDTIKAGNHPSSGVRNTDTVRKSDSGSCVTFEYGGQVYHTIIIGSQCWMKENLNIGKWLDQSQNQTQLNNEVVEKYCYGNDFVECDLWGGL